jgi:hypothetical protein
VVAEMAASLKDAKEWQQNWLLTRGVQKCGSRIGSLLEEVQRCDGGTGS